MGDELQEFERFCRAMYASELIEGGKIGVEPWAGNFRKAARSDQYSHFRSHLERLRQGESWHITCNKNLENILDEPEYYYCPAPIPKTPKLMLENTIEIVTAVLAYAHNTNANLEKFLAMQQYDPSKAVGARYLFTFDLGNAVGRLFTDRRMRPLDLADLFGHPWPKLKRVGYSKIWVSHPDWSPLTKAEFRFVESKITKDIRYDYDEDELELQFESSEDASYLLVYFIEEDESLRK